MAKDTKQSKQTPAAKSAKKPPALKPADFVHLHNHTQYSLLDGLTKIPEMLDFVKEAGMTAIAKTDHGTLSGTIEFYKEAKQRGIKPIIGMETYVAARTFRDRDPSKDKLYYHLTLLAMNNKGYQNLMRVSTIANLEGLYYKPRVDHDLLKKYNEGLIVLSGCIGGEIGDNLRQEQYDKARDIANWYKEVFGDRYYLEVQDHGHPDHPSKWGEQVEITKATLKLAAELEIPCVVTSDAHYLKHEDQEAHELLLCVQTGAFLTDERRMTLKNFELHVTDPKEIIGRWGKEHPELVRNAGVIAERCNVEIELGKTLIPKFPVPKGNTETSYLIELTYHGLVKRYLPGKKPAKSIEEIKKQLPKEVVERAEYELGVIGSMGFNGYFLIVADFINWGKNRGIVFGPGRGSGASSIVAYGLRITEIEPLKYALLFERFLNPHRISMPDFDVDIQDTRRDEVIEYCNQKYGHDRVANIVTFGRMAARNAVRDVARVLQVPYAEADRWAKMIPPPVQGRHIPLKDSLKNTPELAAEYKNDKTARQVFDLAVQLEGTIRSHGVHAAGVVIAPDDIVKFVPLELAQKGVVATQYPMGPIEELGLLKMDFLGLSNLTTLKNALRIIKKVYGQNIELETLPLDDEKTYELLRRGDTIGVFQLESAGMKRYLKELKPTEFEDIIAMGALYRPGPMEQIPAFIKGKNNPASVTYLHDSLKPVLEDTYGVIVYQENIIQLLQLVAGYTPGEADLVRKAIGKKKRDIMAAEEPKFIAGCVRQGLSTSDAERLWAQIQPFADYSFNKAHATCYAMISYQTAYLKAHYPDAYMAALMTSDFDDTDRLSIEISECQHMGLAVLPPDINESFGEFGIVPGKQQIRFGMNAIKNVGAGAVEEIIRAREELGGRFESLEQFLGAVNSRVVNRKVMESLVKAGAFDSFGDRSTLLYNLDLLLAFAARLQKQALAGQTDLFGESLESKHTEAKLQLEEPVEIDDMRTRLQWERELLGLYLSQHPLEQFAAYLDEKTMPLDKLKPEFDNRSVVVGGSVTSSREITTKNGQKMAFVALEDKNGSIEAVLFPGAYQQTLGIWERDRVVLIRGKLQARDRDGNLSEELKVVVEDAREITPEQAKAYESTGKKLKLPQVSKNSTKAAIAKKPDAPGRVYIRLENGDNHDLLLSLKQTIDSQTGDSEVVLVMGNDATKQIIRLPGRVSSDRTVLDKFEQLVGAGNVRYQ